MTLVHRSLAPPPRIGTWRALAKSRPALLAYDSPPDFQVFERVLNPQLLNSRFRSVFISASMNVRTLGGQPVHLRFAVATPSDLHGFLGDQKRNHEIKRALNPQLVKAQFISGRSQTFRERPYPWWTAAHSPRTGSASALWQLQLAEPFGG